MIRIDRAIPSETGRLSEIARAAKAHWGYPPRWLQIWHDALTVTPDLIERAHVLCARQDADIIGFCALTIAGGGAEIEHLWVDPDHMGRGVGRALFRQAVTTARAHAATRITVESDPNAEGFYRRMGAVRVGENVSELDGRPRVLPVLALELEQAVGRPPSGTGWDGA